jgi:RNA polymerase sigma-70 factor (ECF subfamily)
LPGLAGNAASGSIAQGAKVQAEPRMSNRTNEAWLEALRAAGPAREAALADLRQVIVTSLPYAVAQQKTLAEPELQALADDVAQETLVRVLTHLGSFEGRSRFTTWVLKISVRVAFTELRRRHWQDVPLDQQAFQYGEAAGKMMADTAAGPERVAEQASMAALVHRMLSEELTERQQQAMRAMLRGMPLEEIARRLGTERNALYKLLHDARLRLRRRLEKEGLSPGEVLALFERR